MVAAKSTSDASKVTPFPPHPNSPQSTISTVEREIREAGGEVTAIPVDVRDYESTVRLVEKTIEVRVCRAISRCVPDPRMRHDGAEGNAKTNDGLTDLQASRCSSL